MQNLTNSRTVYVFFSFLAIFTKDKTCIPWKFYDIISQQGSDIFKQSLSNRLDFCSLDPVIDF